MNSTIIVKTAFYRSTPKIDTCALPDYSGESDRSAIIKGRITWKSTVLAILARFIRITNAGLQGEPRAGCHHDKGGSKLPDRTAESVFYYKLKVEMSSPKAEQ